MSSLAMVTKDERDRGGDRQLPHILSGFFIASEGDNDKLPGLTRSDGLIIAGKEGNGEKHQTTKED